MNRFISLAVIAAAGVVLPAETTRASGNVFVQFPAVVNPDAPIASSVPRECNVESMVAIQVHRAMSRRDRNITLLRDPQKVADDDKVVRITILAVRGVGGDYTSGATNMTFRVDLIQNAEVIASSVFSRGAMYSPLKGICSMLESAASNLGRKVERWLPGALAGGTSPFAIGVLVPAVLDVAVVVPEDVKLECGVETLVGDHVFQRVSRRFPGAKRIVVSGTSATDNVLRLTIVKVQNLDPAGHLPDRILALRADLLQNDKVISTSTFERSKSGVRGHTCRVLEQVGVSLGGDVAGWLQTVVAAATPEVIEELEETRKEQRAAARERRAAPPQSQPPRSEPSQSQASQSQPSQPQIGPKLEDLPLQAPTASGAKQ